MWLRYKCFMVDENLNIYNLKGKKLTPFKGSDGYLQVATRYNQGRNKKGLYHIRVHRLFAELFIDNPNGYKYVNHKDSDKTNVYDLSNLEWCTNSMNVKHGWDSGNRTHKNNTAVAVYDQDGNLLKVCKSIREVASNFPVDRHKVARILKGEYVNHYPYKFEYTKVQRLLKG